MTTYEPIGDRVLIKPNPKETTKGGFELLESERKQDPTGTVIAVGTGVPLHNIKLNIEGNVTPEILDQVERIVQLIENGRAIKVKPGDVVTYGQYAGTLTRLKDDPAEYLMIRESDIFMRISESNTGENDY